MKYIVNILFILLLISAGCKTVIKKVYGANSAAIESSSSITDWLSKNSLPVEHVFSFSADNFYENLGIFGSGKSYVFNKKGEFLAYGFSNGKYCPKGIDEILSTLKPQEQVNFSPDKYLVTESILVKSIKEIRHLDKFERTTDTTWLSIDSLNKEIYYTNGLKAKFSWNEDIDYILIIPFAKYFGNRIQVTDIRKLINAAKKNPYSKFTIILLNLDKQVWWSEEDKKRINVKI